MKIEDVSVGDKIKFAEEKQRYIVQAKGTRYLVCTKPFNPKKTVLYTVVDSVKLIRGTENLILGFGAETREQCEDMISRLESTDICKKTEVSHRNNIPLNVEEVFASPAS